MDPDLERVFRAIDEAAAASRAMSSPVTLTEDYLHAINRVEAMAQNQSGTDKTWLWEALERDRLHFARAVRL